jgi:hypothetical protein
MRTFIVALARGLALVSFASLAFAADSSYQLKVEAAPAKKAEKATARIVIVAGPGYHMNKDYPTSLRVEAPAGTTVHTPKLTAKEAVKFEEAGATFEVAYTASEKGPKTFTGEIKFAVCTANTCDPKKEKLTFTVDVK